MRALVILDFQIHAYRDSKVKDSLQQRRVPDGAERAADAILLFVQVSGAVQLQEPFEHLLVSGAQLRAVARRTQVSS